MRPGIRLAALRECSAGEYLVRFAFGGIVTAATGLVAQAYGPSVGGLFLAFPGILPATLTLVASHDGRRRAADSARGAVLGAVALVAFPLVVRWLVRPLGVAPTLGLATVVWVVAAGALWAATYGRRRG